MSRSRRYYQIRLAVRSCIWLTLAMVAACQSDRIVYLWVR